jgi:hypothetical protein
LACLKILPPKGIIHAELKTRLTGQPCLFVPVDRVVMAFVLSCKEILQHCPVTSHEGTLGANQPNAWKSSCWFLSGVCPFVGRKSFRGFKRSRLKELPGEEGIKRTSVGYWINRCDVRDLIRGLILGFLDFRNLLNLCFRTKSVF